MEERLVEDVDPRRRGVQDAEGLPFVLIDLLGHGVEVVERVLVTLDEGVKRPQEALLAEGTDVGLVHPVDVGGLPGGGEHLELLVPILAAGIEALHLHVGVRLGEALQDLVVVRDQRVARAAVEDLERYRPLGRRRVAPARRRGRAARRQGRPGSRRQGRLQHPASCRIPHRSVPLWLHRSAARRRELRSPLPRPCAL